MHYQLRLCILVMFHVMFHVYRFEPHTCIAIEGFSALDMQ